MSMYDNPSHSSFSSKGDCKDKEPCKIVDGQSIFKGAGIIFGNSDFISAYVFVKVGDDEVKVERIHPNEDGYYEFEAHLCAEYIIKWKICEGEEVPVFHESAINPSSPCDKPLVSSGNITSTTLETDCFNTDQGKKKLTPVVVISDGVQSVIYFQGATPFTGKVEDVCQPFDCEKCCDKLKNK